MGELLPAVSRQWALDMFASHRAHPAGVVLCQACGCPWLAHYGSADQRGCVACEGRDEACLLYIQGPAPYNLSKHADRLDANGPCPWLCGHPAAGHSVSYGCLECACQFGVTGAAEPRGITYRGYPVSDRAGHRIVVMEAPAGMPVTRLPGVARDRPAGFAWGGEGPGQAALARSLLISALGSAAACPSCQGNRSVAWEAGLSALVPYDAEYDEPPGEAFDCECGDGYRCDLPDRAFSLAVVGRWDEDSDWAISRTDILGWLVTSSPGLYVAAVTALPDDERPGGTRD